MELFKQAATIMVLGMGLVFVFLAFVILCVQAVARVIQRVEARQVADGAGGAGEEAGGELIAAIAVAIRDQPAGTERKR
jgi:sodium pump decarboxylase gamma subunit